MLTVIAIAGMNGSPGVRNASAYLKWRQMRWSIGEQNAYCAYGIVNVLRRLQKKPPEMKTQEPTCFAVDVI